MLEQLITPAYKGIKAGFLGAQQQLPVISAGIDQLNSELAKLQTGISKANAGYTEILKNQANISTGLQQLLDGIDQQQKGQTNQQMVKGRS